MQILNVTGLKKVYTTRFGGSQVTALRQVDFSVEEGEYVAIMGESGSGKTTLLNILAALDKPTAGRVELDGRDMSAVRESDAAAFRRDNLGFVFQEFNLLDTFTLRDNIYLPLVLAGRPYRELKARLDPIARQLGILELLDKYPYEVSGGQKQRAAVARALITHPRLILADEPTGALDSRSTDELLDLFAQINRQGQTILMVTHSVKAASHAGRVLFIKDGQVFHQLYRGQCTDEQLYQKIADTLPCSRQAVTGHEAVPPSGLGRHPEKQPSLCAVSADRRRRRVVFLHSCGPVPAAGGNAARQRLRAGDPESGQLCAVGVFSAAAVLHPFLPDPPPEPGVCPV